MHYAVRGARAAAVAATASAAAVSVLRAQSRQPESSRVGGGKRFLRQRRPGRLAGSGQWSGARDARGQKKNLSGFDAASHFLGLNLFLISHQLQSCSAIHAIPGIRRTAREREESSFPSIHHAMFNLAASETERQWRRRGKGRQATAEATAEATTATTTTADDADGRRP